MNAASVNPYILSIIVFFPVAAAFCILFMRRERDIRWFALAASLIVLMLALHLPWHFAGHASGFQYEMNAAWISSPNIHYHVGIDGISLWLVVLTAFLVPFCILISWKEIRERVKEFFILLLVLETAIIGVFIALDLFLFYVFWEATLIPMTLLIGMYGHERRIHAAVKFFLYTMIASVFMLAAIIWLYGHTGSFDFVALQSALNSGQLALSSHVSLWLFLGFFVAFGVKVAIFPFHTWAPDAYAEAPTAASVILAGVLLKMGTYGLLRFNVGLFPEQARFNQRWISILALIAIIYGALVAMVQPTLKKMIAYSSISHVGFIVLGIFSLTQAGIDGAIYQMLNHGVSTSALFMLAGMLYERRNSYKISEYGGLATPMPACATLFLIFTLSSIGLPLMNGFIGEYLILTGSFQARAVYGILAASGVIWSAAYMLWLYQRVFYGGVELRQNETLHDLSVRERVSLWPLAVTALIMGVLPMVWLRSIDPATSRIVSSIFVQQTTSERHVPAWEQAAQENGR